MSPEDKPEQHDEATEAKPSATDAGTGDVDWKAEAEKWKTLSRKHEGQAKSNADAAKRLSELEDANKTESQKLTEQMTAAEKRAAEAEAKATRYEVAAELGIQTKHLKYLSGSTRDEIEAAAKAIREDFPETYADPDTGTGTPSRPKERLRSGAVPDEEPDETDPRKLAAAVPRL